MRLKWKKVENIWFVNSSRFHLRRRNELFASRIEKDQYVLDAGSGSAPYRELFEFAKYETADFEALDKEYRPSTYVCNLNSIPVEDERFHFIVFNQVMEHLPDPLIVLREFYRILKPGGRIICTCPLFYEEHEKPYDYYRYTQFAHRYLFERAGFDIELIDWLEGYFGTVGYQMECLYKYLPVNPNWARSAIFGWAVAPVVIFSKLFAFTLAGIFYRIDMRFRYTAGGLPKNYVVIARKA